MNKIIYKNIEVEIEDKDCFEITSIKKDGVEFLYQKENDWKKDFPILFPICGMLKDDKFIYKDKEYYLKRHGFFREINKWKNVSQTDNKVIYEYFSNGEFKDNYPWEFKLEIIVEIKDDEVLLTNKVTNLSNEKMFYSLGYHPAFLVKKEGTISFDIEQPMFKDSQDLKYLVKNPKNSININGKKINDIDFEGSQFYWNSNNQATSFEYEDDQKEMTIDLNYFKNKAFLLWSESNQADYVCFEPMDGFADYSERMDYEIINKDGILVIDSNHTKEHHFYIKIAIK